MAKIERNVTLVGTGTQPKMKYTAAGKAITEVTICCTPSKKDRATGQWSDGETEFYRVTCWERLAENVAELDKGVELIVVGRLKPWKQTNEQGEVIKSGMGITADYVGPSLAWATAEVTRNGRDRKAAGGGAQAQQGAPAAQAPPKTYNPDEEPF